MDEMANIRTPHEHINTPQLYVLFRVFQCACVCELVSMECHEIIQHTIECMYEYAWLSQGAILDSPPDTVNC